MSTHSRVPDTLPARTDRALLAELRLWWDTESRLDAIGSRHTGGADIWLTEVGEFRDRLMRADRIFGVELGSQLARALVEADCVTPEQLTAAGVSYVASSVARPPGAEPVIDLREPVPIISRKSTTQDAVAHDIKPADRQAEPAQETVVRAVTTQPRNHQQPPTLVGLPDFGERSAPTPAAVLRRSEQNVSTADPLLPRGLAQGSGLPRVEGLPSPPSLPSWATSPLSPALRPDGPFPMEPTRDVPGSDPGVYEPRSLADLVLRSPATAVDSHAKPQQAADARQQANDVVGWRIVGALALLVAVVLVLVFVR